LGRANSFTTKIRGKKKKREKNPMGCGIRRGTFRRVNRGP